MITVLALALIASPSQELCGSIEQQGPVEVLNLWGSWTDMGYAHGYLMAPRIKLVYETYMVELAGGVSNIDYLRLFYTQHFSTPEPFSLQAAGMVAGMADSIDLYSQVFGRNLDTLDVLLATAVQDFSGATPVEGQLCSSVSAWGAATDAEPELEGSPALSRNLDYYVDTGGNIYDAQLLLACDPDSGREFVSVGFAGYMGVLSGMNSSGLCATLNMGDHTGISSWEPDFVPITMAMAMGLFEEDFNGSGSHDAEDMVAALTGFNRSSSFIIHVSSPGQLAWQEDTALVVEVNNLEGYAIRSAGDEPAIAPGHIAATNHHRKLYTPSPGWRYPLLVDSMSADPEMSLERFWSLMGCVGFETVPGSGGTIQTMILMPEQLRIGLALSDGETASWQQDPTWLSWDDLFPNHGPQGAEGASGPPCKLKIFPNPARFVTNVQTTPGSEIRLFDLTGRRAIASSRAGTDGRAFLDLTDLPSGLYLVVACIEGRFKAARIAVLGQAR